MRRSGRGSTVRRFSVAVAALALAMGGARHARDWSRWSQAKRRHASMRAFYDEGRVPLERMIESSCQLMAAEQGLRPTTRGRVAAMDNHIARAAQFVASERKEWPSLFCHAHTQTLLEIEEAEGAIALVRAARDRLAGWSR